MLQSGTVGTSYKVQSKFIMVTTLYFKSHNAFFLNNFYELFITRSLKKTLWKQCCNNSRLFIGKTFISMFLQFVLNGIVIDFQSIS